MLIKLDSRGPVFYRQVRIAQYGKEFRIFKYRTMVLDADKQGALLTVSNDARVTRIGDILRDYHLDELPQLYNVFLGEISFVGTRPSVKKYVDMYTDEMMPTLLLPAGVTSLASIKFKDESSLLSSENTDEFYMSVILPEKMKYNLQYLVDFTLLLDIKIMLQTVFAVLGIGDDTKSIIDNTDEEETKKVKVA